MTDVLRDTEESEPPVSEARKRLLVVEDDKAIRNLFQAYLKRSGYEVVTAENGRDGLERIAEARPDAIVLDLMMPEMSGYDVLRHLEEADPELLSRVLVVSAITRDDLWKLRDRGVQCVLAKPVELDDLIACVRDALHENGAA